MTQAKAGDRVAIRFTAKTDDGLEIASSDEGQYIEITLGQGEMIPAIEAQIMTMNPGDNKSFHVAEEEAFPYDDGLVFPMERSQLPPDAELKVGDQIALQDGEGRTLPVVIIEMEEESIVLDANPPFAGEALNVELEFSKVVS